MAHSSPVKLDYVAAGCNRVVGALDWADEDLIAYCAHHAIAIYDPSTSSIVSTLLGHTDTVTCLRWFKASDFGLESQTTTSLADQPQTLALASGGGDGSVNLWLLTLQNPSQPWILAATLPAHKASAVTSITIHNAGSPGQMVLVTTAGDGDVSIWSTIQAIPQPSALVSITEIKPSSSSQWNLLQRIRYGTKIQHCSAITALPSEPKCLLLALGGVDGKVRLLLSSSPSSSPSSAQSNSMGSSEFKLMCELAGHQNWVRGLAFTHLKDSKMLLASASQDRYIRLWAITPESFSPVFSAGTHPDSESTDLTTTKSSYDASVKAQSTSLAASLMRFAPRPRFSSPLSSVTYQATLEALLIGHEDWVHSVAWKPSSNVDDVPCLLSASMDRTMALWIPDTATGMF
jgi:elongator complex protein 2